jgi:hypothetical protein
MSLEILKNLLKEEFDRSFNHLLISFMNIVSLNTSTTPPLLVPSNTPLDPTRASYITFIGTEPDTAPSPPRRQTFLPLPRKEFFQAPQYHEDSDEEDEPMPANFRNHNSSPVRLARTPFMERPVPSIDQDYPMLEHTANAAALLFPPIPAAVPRARKEAPRRSKRIAKKTASSIPPRRSARLAQKLLDRAKHAR